MVTLEQKEKGMKTVRMGAVLIGILFAFNAPSVTYAQEQNEAAKKVPKAAIQEQTRRGEAEPKVTIERAIQSAVADVRGRVHEVDGWRVVVTYHPSAAIRFGPNGAPLAFRLPNVASCS